MYRAKATYINIYVLLCLKNKTNVNYLLYFNIGLQHRIFRKENWTMSVLLLNDTELI